MMKKIIMLFLSTVIFQTAIADDYNKSNFKILELNDLATNQGWYVTYQINDNTYAILAPHHWQETVSFLMVGSEKALLIDTGMGFGNIKHTVDAITDLPVIVVNTHSHYDHVSNNHHFDTVYGRQLDYTRKNSSGHPKTTWTNALQPSAVNGPLPAGFSFGAYESKPFKISKYLMDGEIIELGNRNIEVIFTPGHTPDSMLFFDREAGLLATGDTFYPSTLWAHRADANFKDYLASAKKMAEMESQVKYILPGHGEIVANPNFLGKLYQAFLDMRKPETDFEARENHRRYEFDGFAALVAEPPED
ncbi:MBL fold metallo-hydrolase [Pseudemcibacter aquimaris]|uniref:MBL fold metallo-hydrolase n=1 Tax=Pseudemcibacter aquimaris TaxID=2857064 RepID=UPI002013026F|nr:MBL fold metallo-hydrolase [Pseudemcibacter aquimaris]MCC3859635.1 MBL fold metallo-hydrolase [Pseudemcibacter aquimaris]WDU60031.1 MBL fold metallo-hydrolase [Pseudemcibacter aquimaris]